MDVAEQYPWSGVSHQIKPHFIRTCVLNLQLAELTLKLLTASVLCACALPCPNLPRCTSKS